MRAIDNFLHVLGWLTFLILLVLPDSRATIPLVCAWMFAVGLYGVLYPPGILGWVKVAHPQLDPLDERLWDVPRFIGAFFIIISLVLALLVLSK